jgi:2'-5' RNA ligase
LHADVDHRMLSLLRFVESFPDLGPQVMPRLFTAVEIPRHVADSLSMMRGGLPGARWIDPENYHLTLRFIGDIDAALARDIAGLLGRVRRRPFELRLDGLSSFGGRKPRALVASVTAVAPLLELQAEHERLLRRLGLEPEGRKYIPHVTLARLRDTSSWQVADYLSARGHFRSASFEVSRFVLFSSRSSVGGGPYVVEADYPLGAPELRYAHQ